MNRYYLNEEEPVGGGEFTADISFMRTFANIFAKEEQAILKVGGCQCFLSQCLFNVYMCTFNVCINYNNIILVYSIYMKNVHMVQYNISYLCICICRIISHIWLLTVALI